MPRHSLRCAFRGLLLAVCMSAGGTAFALDLNLATEAQLDGLQGLGPSSTARILQARESAPFKDWADFMVRVKGIKSRTATKLSEQGLTINGAPYASGKP